MRFLGWQRRMLSGQPSIFPSDEQTPPTVLSLMNPSSHEAPRAGCPPRCICLAGDGIVAEELDAFGDR